MSSTNTQGRKILLAASMVSMVLGSVHAFSVFLEPLESLFGKSRATVSLIYSFSLIFLTIAVLFGPAIYSRLRPATIYLWVAILGVAGAGIAGFGGSFEFALIGYSLVFGLANGLGYGFGLQFAARANPDHSGLAMGVVTAAYALGAVLAPYGFKLALAFGGFSSAMMSLGSVTIVVGLCSALVVARSGVHFSYTKPELREVGLPLRRIAMLWIAYGSGVSAGLMTIGHAAGIAATAGFSGWVAAAVVAGCNLVGSLFSGWLSDKISHRSVLTVLPLLGALALLALPGLPALTIALLGIVGFAYGGTIAAYPAAVAKLFPGENGPRVYGRVFTAWGVAGLVSPWLAGQIYDLGSGYAMALWIAAGLGVLSAIVARRSIRAV